MAALASSDSSLARYTVEQAQVQGLGILRIYLDILVSSQIDLGEMWHEGKINIAQEHLATTITLDIMNKLSIESTPRKPHGYRAIVTPVEGDNHIIGARMMGDFLKMDGWDVDFMGQPTPPQDLVAYFKNRPVVYCPLSNVLLPLGERYFNHETFDVGNFQRHGYPPKMVSVRVF